MIFDVAKAIIGGLAAFLWIAAWQLMDAWLAWGIHAALGGVIVAGLVYITPNRMTGYWPHPMDGGKK